MLGDEDPSTLTALNTLAHTRMALGNLPEATALFEDFCEKAVQILGEKNERTLSGFANLAGAYQAIGRHEKAVTTCDKVLALGVPLTRKTEERIVAVYIANGLHEKAAMLHGSVVTEDCAEMIEDVNPPADADPTEKRLSFFARLRRLFGPSDKQ